MKRLMPVFFGAVIVAAVAMKWADRAAGAEPTPKPANINPYNGIQDRQEVYEFTTSPAVKKEAGKWVITFASKAYCDATVAILDKEGRILRHLASGVLGKNAPYPFQQNLLSQRVEWDGEDDMGRQVPAEVLKDCKVKVGLGLQAQFERNLLGSVYDMAARLTEYWTSTDADGNFYVISAAPKEAVTQGRIFNKDGEYVRTFFPPPASDLEKYFDLMHRGLGPTIRFAQTIWGDKTLVSAGGPRIVNMDGLMERVGGGKPAKGPLPEVLAKQQPAEPKVGSPVWGSLWAKVVGPCAGTRLAVDRYRDELYVGPNRANLFRVDTKTGELDTTWTPIGPGLSDCCVGPDGLVYIRLGAFGYGQWIVRLDRDGNPVPFNGDSYDLLDYAKRKAFPETAEQGYGTDVPGAFKGKVIKALWTGLVVHSNTHDRGLHVSPRGHIVAQMQSVNKDYATKHGFGERFGAGNVNVWDSTGKLLTADAIGPTVNGRGVGMDRDGNIYSVIGSGTFPTGQKVIDGIADESVQRDIPRAWSHHGTLVKFRGRGEGVYPLNVGESSVKLGPKATERPGALWAYGGITNQTGDCMCHNLSYDMDYFARFWIPANHLGSIMVIDSNGNRLARFGRYGNIDDTEADVKAGKDGLRFVWPRAVAASDKSLYVTDELNHRILKATLKYAVEETVALP